MKHKLSSYFFSITLFDFFSFLRMIYNTVGFQRLVQCPLRSFVGIRGFRVFAIGRRMTLEEQGGGFEINSS